MRPRRIEAYTRSSPPTEVLDAVDPAPGLINELSAQASRRGLRASLRPGALRSVGVRALRGR